MFPNINMPRNETILNQRCYQHSQIGAMFNFRKKDQAKELQKVINRKLEQARDVQRSGDIKAYALLMGEIDELQKKLETQRPAD